MITEVHQETVSSLFCFKVRVEKDLGMTTDQCLPLGMSNNVGICLHMRIH